MNRIRRIEGFSLALLVLAFAVSLGTFYFKQGPLPPMMMTFLLTGLVGSLAGRALRAQQLHLLRLQSEIERLRGARP